MPDPPGGPQDPRDRGQEGIRSTVSAGDSGREDPQRQGPVWPWNPEHCECLGWPREGPRRTEKDREARKGPRRPEKDREDCLQ